jgi:ketosteroid isomerase-like protein
VSSDKELVSSWFTALNEGRLEDAWAVMDPSCEYWLPRTRTAVPASVFAGGYTKLVSERIEGGLLFDVGEMTAEEGRVSVRAESHGKLKGGPEYNNLYHFLFELDGGRIIKVWEYGDTLHAATVLG